jgi:hypothetical protein
MNQEQHHLTDARAQVHAMEQRLLGIPGAWDHPERQALWPELAWLNAQLGRDDEAAVCWLNALWEADQPRSLVQAWARSELQDSSSSLAKEGMAPPVLPDEPTERDARKLSAFLLWAVSRPRLSESLADSVKQALATFERVESVLPLRAVWLVWQGVGRVVPEVGSLLSSVAERLLRRLQGGLDARSELPACLQTAESRAHHLGDWFVRLHELAQNWLGASTNATSQTPAYVRLMFAFGLACLKRAGDCLKLRQQAASVLASRDDVHKFLLNALEYRIEQALEGRALYGPLPTEALETLNRMERLLRYVVERLRKHSRILEPDQRINPSRHWGARINDFERALASLTDLPDREELASRVDKLLREVPKGPKGNEQRARVLRAGLEAAPRIGEDFARKMLEQTVPAYDALPEAKEMAALMDQAAFLEKALFVAGRYGRMEAAHLLVARVHRLLQGQKGPQALQVLDSLAAQCFRGLRKLGMRDEIDQLLRQMADLVLEGQDVKAIDFKKREQGPAALRALLQVAAGWYFFGRDSQAEPILQAARGVLLAGYLPPRDQTQLAAAYAIAVGHGPLETGQARLEELFRRVFGIRDTYTSASHFSVSQLDVIEAVVLAVVSEQGLAQQQMRRWLDENEALIRRRIHHDLAVLAGGGFAL